jgi:hypothetical protein
MPLDDLPLRVQLLIGLIVPPILTVLCWVIGRRLAGSRRPGFRMWSEPGFWTMLISAYLLLALALAGARSLNKVEQVDPSSQLVQ